MVTRRHAGETSGRKAPVAAGAAAMGAAKAGAAAGAATVHL